MKAFLTGLGLGIAGGFLIAPDRGEETRKKLRYRVNDLSQEAKRRVENLSRYFTSSPTRLEVKENPSTYLGQQLKKAIVGDEEQGNDQIDTYINTIGRDELMNVYGIGPVLADRIIENRPYRSAREMVERGIVPESAFNELERELLNLKKSA